MWWDEGARLVTAAGLPTAGVDVGAGSGGAGS